MPARIDSPLRYPGGKTKLYNFVQPIVKNNIGLNNRTYIEPFAGGSGLALKLLFQNDVDYLILNDIDPNIYSFWDSCLHNTDDLCEMINSCTVDMDTWISSKNIYSNSAGYTSLELGFATFFLNRCNVSGVIRGGPIGGKNQTGKYLIDARFNKDSLINKIQKIGQNNHRIDFFNLDASDFLLKTVPKYDTNNCILNIDPPYVNKGSMLYENSFSEADHAMLANVIGMLNHKWFVTYDKTDLIYYLYPNNRKEIITLKYSVGDSKTGEELMIYSDLINLSFREE